MQCAKDSGNLYTGNSFYPLIHSVLAEGLISNTPFKPALLRRRNGPFLGQNLNISPSLPRFSSYFPGIFLISKPSLPSVQLIPFFLEFLPLIYHLVYLLPANFAISFGDTPLRVPPSIPPLLFFRPFLGHYY